MYNVKPVEKRCVTGFSTGLSSGWLSIVVFYGLLLALLPISRKRYLAVQQAVDGLLECLKRLGADDGFAVNDETGCALHADLTGNIGLRLHQLGVFAAIQAFVESFAVQVQVFSKGF